jgi:hypothetical protein
MTALNHSEEDSPTYALRIPRAVEGGVVRLHGELQRVLHAAPHAIAA